MTKPKQHQRLRVVGARLTPAEWRWLEAQMKARRARMSVVVRDLLLRGYTPPEVGPARRRRQATGAHKGSDLG